MADRSPLRVGLEVGKVAGISDGIGRYARGLLRALLELDDGPEMVLYDLADDRIGDRPPVRLRGSEAPVATEHPTALDVFHSTGFALPPAGEIPLVITVHDLTFITHPDLHTRVNRARASAAMMTAVARRATVIAVSGHTRGEVEQLLGVPSERIVVVHEAPDRAFGIRAPSERPDPSPAPVPGRYVLAVGSLEPRKNLVGLLDGMMELPAALRRELQLVVVGPGGWHNRVIRDRLQRARRRLAVRELGYVSTERLAELYRGATVFAYPSLSEGFGLPVLEAMACGAPVLTSNRASLPEVAGDAAVLVDPVDPVSIAGGIERLVTDDEFRAGMVAKGFDNVRRFSWDRCARETVTVYHRVAERGAAV
jgi:alpha-1,3-rhamnosyl/mannosyltransferase